MMLRRLARKADALIAGAGAPHLRPHASRSEDAAEPRRNNEMLPADTRLLERIADGLYATPPAPLPFRRDVQVRAFLLQRSQGNLIVYNAPGLTPAADEIAGLGGADRQLINHGHEAMFGPQSVGAPVFVHERDKRETAASMPVAGTFADRRRLDDDFELIPTPGHTPGATAFLWESRSHRFLFPGDTLWIEDGRWSAVVLGDSDRAAYVESLEALRELDFDVLVPWGAVAGEPFVEFADSKRTRDELDAVIARLRAGGTG